MSSASADVQMQWGIKIPLRDGVHLNATRYLPSQHAAPTPVLFTLTPYIAQTYHDQGLYFARHGYPFLAVDVRGRGNSDGAFRPLIQEAEDGHDVVEWLARQAYCNGQVAMWGGSYAGYNQWSTAKLRPAHLATIVPAAACRPGVDFPIGNNIGFPYAMQWLTLVAGRTSQDQMFWNQQRFWRGKYRRWLESGTPFKTLDTFWGNPSPIFQEWMTHPHEDAYWDRYNPTADEYARISLPILTITGIYDSDQPGALMHHREHLTRATQEARAHHYLVIGPWDHAGTRVPQAQFAGNQFGAESLLDLGKLHLEWYAWTMQGGPRPTFLRNNVAYYVLGAEEWRYADALETITAEHKALYLNSSGSASSVFASGVLSDEPATGGPDSYVYNPQDIQNAAVEEASTDLLALRPTFPVDNVRDQTVVLASEGRQLVYHSFPFAEDVEISGFFKLTAWIAIDRPDTDFGVSVYEIGQDGGSFLLTCDRMRARYRKSFRTPQLIQTMEPLRYDFERFTFVSRRSQKGSRLRLVIGPVNSIYFEKNYNSGGLVAEESVQQASPVTVKLFHDSSRPSVLHVPIGKPCGED